MSVLIKGMKIPKSCVDCLFTTQSEYSECRALGAGHFNYNEYWHNKKREDCPLISVPTPHGSLVDADAVCDDLNTFCKNAGFETTVPKYDVAVTLERHIVIPAEEKKT